MKDHSIDKTDKALNTYILTNEGNQNIFSLWDILPAPEEVTEWENLGNQEIKKFEEKVLSLKDVENKVNIVVELLITNNGRPFFKLYDTVFLP